MGVEGWWRCLFEGVELEWLNVEFFGGVVDEFFGGFVG